VVTATPDEIPSDAPPGRPGRIFDGPWRALTVGILAVVSLLAFEAMAVATAMPVAVRDLDGLPFYAWGFSAFLIASLVGMVVAGEVSDRRGPVQPFIASLVLFVVGLVVAGLATSMAVFVAGRALQGLGAGLNIVSLYVVVGRLYPEAMRPRLFSVMSSAWVIPALVGPSVAGVVADELSWRWVFLAVPPLVLPAVALMLPRLHGLGAASGSGPVRRRTLPALAVALGVGCLQYAGQRMDLVSLALLPVGAGLLLAGLPRLLPTGIFRVRRGLPTAVLMRGILAGSFFGAETFVPLMLVEERGLATALAGVTLTAGAVSWSVGSWIQGRPGLRTPRHVLVQRGTALVALGVAGVSLGLWSALPPGVAAVGWAIGGLGMGLAMSSTNVVVLSLSPEAEQGFNSSALQLSDALGSVILIGVGGALFAGMHRDGDSNAGAFLAIYLVMAAVAAVGAALAGRVAVLDRVGADTR
jgi:MFS family permease